MVVAHAGGGGRPKDPSDSLADSLAILAATLEVLLSCFSLLGTAFCSLLAWNLYHSIKHRHCDAAPVRRPEYRRHLSTVSVPTSLC